jgi:ATPase family AAA domain-containing protein 3A/B
MDYAIMSGGDVSSLGESAVDQLHQLFKWASKSSKGLLLFIDEAEAFLSCRQSSYHAHNYRSQDISTRNALNALLYQTGIQSTTFMMVLATNRPEDLDKAVLDRVDISLYIGLPDIFEREKMIKLYINVHIHKYIIEKHRNYIFGLRINTNRANHLQSIQMLFNDKMMMKLAESTQGFSGREISKLFIGIHHAMLLSPNQTLTEDMIINVLKQKMDDHKNVLLFSSKQ